MRCILCTNLKISFSISFRWWAFLLPNKPHCQNIRWFLLMQHKNEISKANVCFRLTFRNVFTWLNNLFQERKDFKFTLLSNRWLVFERKVLIISRNFTKLWAIPIISLDKTSIVSDVISSIFFHFSFPFPLNL